MRYEYIVIVNVLYVNSKDVRLPVQLQRAMAAEAEAAREARAKVSHVTSPMMTSYLSFTFLLRFCAN